MNENFCGCCEGIEKVTPLTTANRPGLAALSYRVGTHATFLETMKACLSNLSLEVPPEGGNDSKQKIYPLDGLTTRDADDPAIAMLDAWATVAAVLTFYQERLANEGYLRTATERRSILELARLVGYKLRPGVAASVYLAFTLENDYEVEVPAGTRAQSLPGPGELPQPFETSAALLARTAWNQLKPRLTRPMVIKPDDDVLTLYFKGIETNLKPNDPILIDFNPPSANGDGNGNNNGNGGNGNGEQRRVYRVEGVTPDPEADRTRVELRAWVTAASENSENGTNGETVVDASALAGGVGPILEEPSFGSPLLTSGLFVPNIGDLINIVIQPPPLIAIPPKTPFDLPQNPKINFAPNSDLASQLFVNLQQITGVPYYESLSGATFTEPSPVKVYALRVTASLFGHNAPLRVDYDNGAPKLPDQWLEWTPDNEQENLIFLDNAYDEILAGSFIAIQKPTAEDAELEVYVVDKIVTRPRTAYQLSTDTTIITLPEGETWWDPNETDAFNLIRGTVVYAQSEELIVAEAPIDPVEEPVSDDSIELEGLYDGLEAGRWLIVSGERLDLGIRASERVMLAGVKQDFDEDLPSEKIHTELILANQLANAYKRDTVTIYGNVVKATHGETREEVLGNGDGSQGFQQFTLRHSPLTYLAAPTPAGAESTLEVRVDEVRRHEAGSLFELGPNDRGYITQINNDDKTSVIFGNGEHGTRLPTGIENVKALYRSGLGKVGNVAAEQISLLATRPLGVKGVINPLSATGGADRDTLDQARRNAPLTVMALDRLVSVQDYADFARTFAGIGKASAVRLSDGRRQLVHVTIAGADNIPIDNTSELYQNLLQALHRHGDPYQPIQLALRELKLMVISAQVRILPNYQWDTVGPEIRDTLLDAFGFERRQLGQDIPLSEVISIIQSVRGVAYVDVNLLDSVSESEARDPELLKQKLEALAGIKPPEGEQQAGGQPEDEEKKQPKPRIVVEMARPDEEKKYHIVQQGDTLWSLANRYGTTVEVLVRLNGIANPNLIQVGKSLLVDFVRVIKPAQLAFLSPDVTGTLILEELS